jgi:hypothetical protein
MRKASDVAGWVSAIGEGSKPPAPIAPLMPIPSQGSVRLGASKEQAQDLGNVSLMTVLCNSAETHKPQIYPAAPKKSQLKIRAILCIDMSLADFPPSNSTDMLLCVFLSAALISHLLAIAAQANSISAALWMRLQCSNNTWHWSS